MDHKFRTECGINLSDNVVIYSFIKFFLKCVHFNTELHQLISISVIDVIKCIIYNNVNGYGALPDGINPTCY